MTNQTRYEILVGLHVNNQDGYNQYRAGMAPILKDHGGFSLTILNTR